MIYPFYQNSFTIIKLLYNYNASVDSSYRPYINMLIYFNHYKCCDWVFSQYQASVIIPSKRRLLLNINVFYNNLMRVSFFKKKRFFFFVFMKKKRKKRNTLKQKRKKQKIVFYIFFVYYVFFLFFTFFWFYSFFFKERYPEYATFFLSKNLLHIYS